MAMDPTAFVHDRALCESEDVGPRTRVWAFAQVMRGASIGADCNICGHAFVESGVVLGDGVTVKNGVQLFTGVTVEDHAFLGPAVVFTNDLNPRAEIKKPPEAFVRTLVRTGATLGANAVVVCGTTLGRYSFAGAGSVVVDDVPDHALVVGNPARQIGWMCTCATRLGDDLSCSACGNTFEPCGGGLRRIGD